MGRTEQLRQYVRGDLIETLRRCGGYYKCPDGPDGDLVGYAGRYDDGTSEKLQYVGTTYYNLAMVEQNPLVLDLVAQELAGNLDFECDVVLGAPMGGITTAFTLARQLGCQFAFAEKKVVQVATSGSREVAKLVLNRHEIARGARVVLVEDVCNNFSTAGEMIDLVGGFGAEVVAIACLVNRSMSVQNAPLVPVIGLLDIPTEQFRQDDPAVADRVAAGRVIWKPKERWDELQRLMAAAR